MNIYYLTSRNLSAEFANELTIGDICIINEFDKLTVCIVTTPLCRKQTKKAYLNLVYSTKGANLAINTNLIFSYNGIKKRYGNSFALRKIMNVVGKNFIYFFLEKCVSLLEYREDRITSGDFVSLYGKPSDKLEIVILPPQYTVPSINETTTLSEENSCLREEDSFVKETIHETKNILYKNKPIEFYFYDFLDEDLQNKWLFLYTQSLPLRDIYRRIKLANNEKFRLALRNFNTKYPNLSIYSLKPNLNKKSNCETVQKELTEFDFFFKELSERGFTQLSQYIWESKEKHRFQIKIEPIN